MRVSDLAKEMGITTGEVLDKLRALKLKAKGPDQELNAAVLIVLKSALQKQPKSPPRKEEPVETISEQGSAKEEQIISKEKKEAKSKTAKKETLSKTAKTKLADKKKKPVQEKEKKKEKTTVTKKTAKKIKKEIVGMKKTVIKKTKVAERPKEIIKRPAREAEESVKDMKALQEPPVGAARQPQPSVVPLKESPKEQRVRIEEKQGLQKITAPGETPAAPQTLKELEVQLPISVKDLSVKMQQKPSVVLKHLMQMGIFAHINQSLDGELAEKILAGFGFSLSKVKTKEESMLSLHEVEEDEPGQLKPRSPVVTFMGHVDHGKTSLLDKIRKSKIVDQEHGGITQHMSAYSVRLPKGSITFLDTPGHEAFTAMRARGAHITDLVVLVIAADEGVMPQTEEAINHARAANVPLVVALNKIDKRNADPDRVKKELADHDLMPEDWGGKTIVVNVSATTGEGVDRLLEMILLEAELLELKANADRKASGIVVEARLSHGKGAVATVIVQNGTLHEGDAIVIGPYAGKIKAMFDDHQRPIKSAGPATPAEILGLSGVPEAGEVFYVLDNEKLAKEIAEGRQQRVKDEKMHSTQKITLEDLYSQIQEGKIKELNIIVKADVQGSVEALKEALVKLSTGEVKLNFIHSGVGVINASDVILAGASNAIILGFNVGMGPRAKEELEKVQVDVRNYRIIYDAINDIKNALEGLLEPRKKKISLGRVEVRNVFKLSKSGMVAGCFVTKGHITRKANVDVVRNGDVVFSGNLSSLKRFKDDVREVREGFECGITVDRFNDYQVGDIFEVYEIETIARKL